MPLYQMIGSNGHPKDLDLHAPGLRNSIADPPAWLLVTIKRVAVRHHNHVFVPMERGAKQIDLKLGSTIFASYMSKACW